MEVLCMRSINVEKLKRLRGGLGLNKAYVAELLSLSQESYEAIESGSTLVADSQLQLLSKIFSVNEEYLCCEDIKSNAIHARIEGDLSPRDEKQIAEFFNFQQRLSKKNKELIPN